MIKWYSLFSVIAKDPKMDYLKEWATGEKLYTKYVSSYSLFTLEMDSNIMVNSLTCYLHMVTSLQELIKLGTTTTF